jgi:hypothetical protein
MLDGEKRYYSAICHSGTCKFFKLSKADIPNLKISTSMGSVLAESLGDRLQTLAVSKLNSITQKIENLKNVTENMRNKTKKKLPLSEEKNLKDVKFKIDREYEKVFLKRMTEKNIIKPTKAIKNINKTNKDYPVTNFYNQLIKEDRKSIR